MTPVPAVQAAAQVSIIEPLPLPTAASARVSVSGRSFRRSEQTFRIAGVTYGPFPPDDHGSPFPAPTRVRDDFESMRLAHINSIRTYHVPPDWLLSLADEMEMAVYLDVPWPKHLCFLDSAQSQKLARDLVREAAKQGRVHPSMFAYSIGNEIPPNIVRWHGARRIERFLHELYDVAKQADPQGLITYANYPSTEYLDLSFLDFATFNVYLHDAETFRKYLLRLQNLVGDRPLLLGEVGMDTYRQSEARQAEHLASQARETLLHGLAGLYVFAWTDEWHTGGYPIQDWAFGITNAERRPRPAYHALAEVFRARPDALLAEAPKVSVVVCAYNADATLEQCVQSLLALEYPDYEVIVVDDGSTDTTSAILARYPQVQTIHQPNRGLSTARNVGLRAAKGSLIAYTDADCFADPSWLTHLVNQIQRGDAVGVGGPNLSPSDGPLAACVAAAPGQPMHVLESDQVAEHVPGCNMAFRKSALEAISGFDPIYRKAGDDVDICWRLQQAGYWITFAPGAFVWHHRRQTPIAYLQQQAGYGEAEALLRFKHPDRFTHRGDGKWRGVLYGISLQGLSFDPPIIFRGTFGTGIFQCIYQPGPAHWAMIPSTLEWHTGAAMLLLTSLFWLPALIGATCMFALSLLIAALQARQARLEPKHDSFVPRGILMGLCYVQPLVRGWHRYRTRIFSYRTPEVDGSFPEQDALRLSIFGSRTMSYWSESHCDRTDLLSLVIAYLNEHGWGKTIDSGWEEWDLEIHCHRWTVVQVVTSQEDHGGGKRVIRTRYRLRFSGTTRLLGLTCLLSAGLLTPILGWLALPVAALSLTLLYTITWWRGTHRASKAVALFDGFAKRLNLVACDEQRDS